MLTCALGAGNASADSLSNQLNFIFGQQGITLPDQETPGPPKARHTAHFTNSSLATLGVLVKQLAPNAADFPAISTVPGLTWHYNPDIQTSERSSGSLGPVFVERPQTLGREKFDFGVNYLYVNFDELNGEKLDGLAFRGLKHNDCCKKPPSPGNPPFENDTADLIFDEFDLESHVVTLSATYGITDRWDVNVLLPIVHTSLDVRARATISGKHTFGGPNGPLVQTQTRTINDDATGVGDLLLRTKYNLYQSDTYNIASGLTLRVPTGNEDNFQGLGDVTVTPYFVLGREIGMFDLHLNAGVEINADELNRSRVRYAGGTTVRLSERLAFLLDIIGNSNVTDSEISVTIPQFVNAPGSGATPTTSTSVSRKINTDIVDLAVGFKGVLAESVIGFANVFIPLTDEGLRADVIPAVGLEMSF